MAPQRDSNESRLSRRSLLCAVGIGSGAATVNTASAYVHGRDEDTDGDGIPDSTKRSGTFHRQLEETFGPEQFEGVAVGRQDLLIDVRYVGPTGVFPATKRAIVDRFRRHGIYAQWLDYPGRYDADLVDEQYGSTVEDLLWGRRSFYDGEIEAELENVALQLLVVPGETAPPHAGRLYSRWMETTGGGTDGYVNGFSVGNRAVVANRENHESEARLVFHELTHLALCHDDDPENTGSMGTGEELDLMDHEWDRLREGLSNVRETTGYDVGFRPCLWDEHLAPMFNGGVT